MEVDATTQKQHSDHYLHSEAGQRMDGAIEAIKIAPYKCLGDTGAIEATYSTEKRKARKLFERFC